MKSLRKKPTKLARLRAHLLRLRRMRATVRCGSAACVALTAVFWLLVAMFVCDWSFDLTIGPRCVVLVAGLVGCRAAFQRSVWPLLTVRETVQDIALIIERQQGIDSDVIAALQFETPAARVGGSSQLAEALIDRVAGFSDSLDLFRDFSYQPLPRRAMVLVATVMIVVCAASVWPGHATAFGNRLHLGAARYPTRTKIESIVINEQSVPDHSATELPRIEVPCGQSVTWKIQCGGQLPTVGIARMVSSSGQLSNQVPLTALSTNRATFVGELSHVADSFRVTFDLGDVRSDPVEVVVVPLPLVDLHWDVTPPSYARSSMAQNDSQGNAQQLLVLEGSTATLNVVCSNKRLQSGQLTIGQPGRSTLRVEPLPPISDPPQSGRSFFALMPSRDSQPPKLSWTLPPENPFEKIHEALTYEIQVIDQDGLSLERPIAGQIRLKVDRRPRIVASAVSQLVLPTAQPKVDYTVNDDFGVARIVAIVQVTHVDGRRARHEIVVQEVPSTNQPVKMIRGPVPIPLSAYELAKGDEVQVVLYATDWRGDGRGQESASDPIRLTVTDINGILTQMSEEDKKTAQQLDEILRRERAVGSDKN